MFLRYFAFIFAPFRAIRNQWMSVRNVQGNIHMDIKRVQSLKSRGKNAVGEFNQKLNQFGQPQQGAQMQQQAGQPPGAPGMPAMPGMPGAPPVPNPNPPVITKGFW